MGSRKVIVKQSVADSIAAIAWYIESKGLIATADKFLDSVYDHFLKLSDQRKSFPRCKEPERENLGYNAPLLKRSTL